MKSHIYLDESGDLGWKFDAPYRFNGSSRYLTIAYLICPITHINIPKRIVREFYTKFSFDPKKEVKANQLKSSHKDYICRKAIEMLGKYPDFRIGAITVQKQNVDTKFRSDGNTLYNYMMGLALIEKIQDHESCKISRDNRSVKVLSGSSCVDYLQTLIWYHNNKSTMLFDNPTHSHTDDGVIFIDWITNMVWSNYEDNYDIHFNALAPHIDNRKLFFK